MRDANISPFVDSGYWLGAKDGDARALALFRRHYSFREYKDGRRRTIFVGPGEKMVLMTVWCDALFIWRKFIDASGQQGVNCAVFRNESPILSSVLILEAETYAWRRWPGQRLYTYVSAKAVQSANPGYCFKSAGWHTCGVSKSGLVILEKLPQETIIQRPREPAHRTIQRVEDALSAPKQLSLL